MTRINLVKFTLVLNYEQFKKALDVLHKKSGIEFDFNKSAAPMQPVGSATWHEYELTVWSDMYPRPNLYPLLRDIEKEVDFQPNRDADARLIAAAPELLKAASAALHYMRLHKYADQVWADDLEAAIAAAMPS